MSDPLPPESSEPQPPLAPTDPPAPPPIPPSSVVEPTAGELPPPPLIEPPKSGMTEANWAMLLHLSPLAALAFCCAPGVAIVGPLIIWLIKRPESAALDTIGKRVLNFQISYAIYSIAAGLVSFVLSAAGIGFLLAPLGIVVGIAWLIFTIVGAVKQSRGEVYVPPLTLELIK